MNTRPITSACNIAGDSVYSAIAKTEWLIDIARDGLQIGANDEFYPRQFSREFECGFYKGVREDLIQGFGGNPFDRQSWNQYCDFSYLDDDEKKRYDTYEDYIDHCENQCYDIFSAILDSLEKYKSYLESLAAAAE